MRKLSEKYLCIKVRSTGEKSGPPWQSQGTIKLSPLRMIGEDITNSHRLVFVQSTEYSPSHPQLQNHSRLKYDGTIRYEGR